MAYPTFGSVNLDTLFVAHGRNYLSSKPKDNYYRGNPTLQLLRKKSKKVSGGTYHMEPILSGGEPVGGPYARGQALPTTPTDPITEATYQIAFYGEPVAIYRQDEWRAGGSGALFDFVEARVDDAQNKLERKLADHLLDSSQTTNGIVPLLLHCDATTTIGGISPSTFSWWAANAISPVTFSSAGLDKMRKMMNDCSFGGVAAPDLLIADQGTWEAYVDLAEGVHDITSSGGGGGSREADLGFPVAKYQGKQFIWDRNMTGAIGSSTGRILFVNHDAFYLLEAQGAAWHLTDFVPTHVIGQMGRIAYLEWAGATVSRCRSKLGNINTIS